MKLEFIAKNRTEFKQKSQQHDQTDNCCGVNLYDTSATKEVSCTMER